MKEQWKSENYRIIQFDIGPFKLVRIDQNRTKHLLGEWTLKTILLI